MQKLPQAPVEESVKSPRSSKTLMTENFEVNPFSVKFLSQNLNKDYAIFQKENMANRMITLLLVQSAINIATLVLGGKSATRNISIYILLVLTTLALGSILLSSKFFMLNFRAKTVHSIARILGVYCLASTAYLFFSLIFLETHDSVSICGGVYGTWNIVLILVPIGIMITIQQGFYYNLSIILLLSTFLILTEILTVHYSKPWCQIPWTAGIFPVTCCIPLAYIHEKMSRLQFASYIEAQQVLENAKQEARKANQTKRDFLSYIFHEIRVPLNAISLGVDMLQSTTSSSAGSPESELQQILRSQLDTTTNILDDVLSLQKIEEGKFEVRMESCELSAFVRTINWTYSKLLEEKRVKYTWSLDSKLPSLISMDKYRIRQVVSNFLSNAAKFVHPGGLIHFSICLQERVEEEEEFADPYTFQFPEKKTVKKQTVRFSVQDSRIGISSEEQKKLFQPYTQVASGKAQKGKGTGLGLSIAKHIVRLHGGEIGVTSKEGEGSCFFFTIPLETGKVGTEEQTSTCSPLMPSTKTDKAVPEKESPESKEFEHCDLADVSCDDGISVNQKDLKEPCKEEIPTAREEDQVDKAGQVSAARKPKILLVEDSIPNRKLLERMIVSWGFECFTATNGVECMDLFSGRAESPFDLVITDQEMPLMNGDEAIRRLRGLGFRMPIVALTGNAFDDQRSLLLAAGADAFLTKPTTANSLKACIQSFVKP